MFFFMFSFSIFFLMFSFLLFSCLNLKIKKENLLRNLKVKSSYANNSLSVIHPFFLSGGNNPPEAKKAQILLIKEH